MCVFLLYLLMVNIKCVNLFLSYIKMQSTGHTFIKAFKRQTHSSYTRDAPVKKKEKKRKDEGNNNNSTHKINTNTHVTL